MSLSLSLMSSSSVSPADRTLVKIIRASSSLISANDVEVSCSLVRLMSVLEEGDGSAMKESSPVQMTGLRASRERM